MVVPLSFMSLPAFSGQAQLFSTAALTGKLFGPTDRYRLMAQKVYPQLVKIRPELERGYCADNGRVAIEPVVLLGVSLLQYLEDLPDRQAVEMMRYHAGWNLALNCQLGEQEFHPTTLVRFRQRLLDQGLSTLAFEVVLDALAQAGLIQRKSRQRLDSTQMLGRVSRMSRLDCVRESLRLALREIGPTLSGAESPGWWSRLWDRYVDSQTDYRASMETLARKLVEVGQDAHCLLSWLAQEPGLRWAQGKQAQGLGRVFDEQFELSAPAAPQPKAKEQLGSERVQNPHDPEATYASKGKGEQRKEHVGYKVQVAETVCEAVLAPGEPTRNFVVGILTHAARESDEQGALKMEVEQATLGMEKPPVQYVDGAYISTQKLLEAAAQGRELIGPAPAPANNTGGHFTSEAFAVTVEQRQAICPAGQPNRQCSRLEEQATGKVTYRFEWDRATCAACPLRPQCIPTTQKHRTLVVGEHHTVLQARRQEQQTEAFKQRLKHRNAIEGTQSELVRAHGMRRARYRGLAKAQLQNYFIGAACNVKRWLRRVGWEIKQGLSGRSAKVAPASH
jgi:transposase